MRHLRHQRVEGVKFCFGSQERDKLDSNVLPVKIAGKIKEMRLQQFFGRIKGRANAQIGSPVQHTTREIERAEEAVEIPSAHW